MNIDLNRLIIAKQMFIKGNEHSNLSDAISRMQAILSWDQSIEVFLKCSPSNATIVANANRDLNFGDVFKNFKSYSMSKYINRMRQLRNEIQHQGNVPSSEEVDKFKVHVSEFIDELCRNEFQLELSQISMTQSIRNEELKNILLEAEKLFEQQKYQEAFDESFKALIKATFDYSTIFEFGGELIALMGGSKELSEVIDSNYLDDFKQDMHYKPLKSLSRAISQLGQATSSMQFWGDYKSEFLRFMRCNRKREDMNNEKLKEEIKFSINFVTKIIIYWEEEGIIE